jgi:hypothetical protein
MTRFFALIAAVALVMACNNKPADNEENESAQMAEAVATDIPVLAVADFDAKAENFADKEVRVTGIVDHVCKHGGKKLLLVVDGASVHVVAQEERFDDALVGQQVSLNGIVREERIDESTCLQMEEDAIKNHSEGEADDEMLARKKKQIKFYRDSMATAGLDHLSYYSLEFIAFNEL